MFQQNFDALSQKFFFTIFTKTPLVKFLKMTSSLQRDAKASTNKATHSDDRLRISDRGGSDGVGGYGSIYL